MKHWPRILFGAALALFAGAAAQAAPALAAAGISASPTSAAPNDSVQFSVSVTNSAAATTSPTNQNDFPAGGTANVTITLTNTTTGYVFTRTGTVSTTSAIAENGGAGTLSGNFTIPTQTTQAGGYRASVTINSVSTGSISSATYAVSTTVLTVTGKPDLKITGLTYPAGTAYRGGDTIPMTLTYTNLISSNGTYNVPYVPSANGDASYFRIEIILSSNPTFGDSDDFLLTSHDISTSPLNADSANSTLNWTQILPGNFAGTYYVMAKIDTNGGVSETIEADLTINGNNIWYSPDINGSRISILPSNFPTVYWASTSSNAYSDNPSVSSDGRYTAFASDATTLGSSDSNGVRDIFLYDNQTSTVRRISVSQQGTASNGASNNPAISSNGTYVAFSSDATNLVFNDTNGFSDIYVVNTLTGVVSRVSLPNLANQGTLGTQANGSSFKPAISATGRYVAFESNATNLINGGTTVGVTHVYLYDRDADGNGTFDETTAGATTTVLISQSTGGTQGGGNSIQAAISADGRYVAFASDATNLVAGDTNAVRDVFLRDVTGGTTIRVSVATGGTQGDGASRAPSINRLTGSANDGRYIAFGSEATNLVAGDTNGVSDIFVYDRVGATTTRVSLSTAGVEATDPSSSGPPDQRLGSINPSISSTGRYVAFASLASNLTTGDTSGQYSATDANGALDIFVRDRQVDGVTAFDTGGNVATTLVSVNRFGYQTNSLLGTPSTAASNVYPVISDDGRWVAFPSDAENTGGLVHSATNRSSPDSNTYRDIFLHDRRINALPSTTTPPSVSISSPVTGTSYPVNTALTVVANASAPAGTIATVQFYVNGTLLVSDSSFPYNATWTPTATGTFALSAVVTDSFGNQAVSSNVNITISSVSPTSPTVSISSPANGASLFANASSTISATASDADGTIAQVEFFANNVSIGTDTTFPYSITFTPVATGNYTLTAVATDNGGNQTTTTGVGSVTVSVAIPTAPTISITSPANASTVQVNAPQTIVSNPSAPSGSVSSVQFLVNGTALATVTSSPFNTTWTPTVAGTYSLSAIITDSLGSQATSASNTVTVSSGASPSAFNLTAPANASTINVNIAQTVSASPTDTDGTIASVQFYVNGSSIGTANSFPYSVSWTPTATGSYTLLGVATDNLGNQTTSGATTVTVTSGTAPSLVVLTAPANLAVSSAGTLLVTATANSGSIATVRFFANGQQVGAVTSSPYSLSWTPVTVGSYSVYAIATDTLGNSTTSNTATVAVGTNQSPTVTIATPADLSSVNPGVATTVTATAADSDGSIASVQFFANGVSLGTDTTSPYSVSWTPVTNGSYLLTAVATDNLGATTTSLTNTITVTTTNLPTVTLTSPTNGSTVPANSSQALTATASAAVGTIAKVEFFVTDGVVTTSLGIDTTFPYTATWTPSANPLSPSATGTYSLYAVATDTSGNARTSTSNGVTVSAGTPGLPSIAIVAPIAATTVAVNNAVVIAANASDSDGSIALVEFLANGVVVGSKTSSPYFTTWTPTVAGAYAITARVTDNENNRTTTAATNITVAAVVGSVPVGTLVFNNPSVDSGGASPDPTQAVDVSAGSNLIFAVGAVDSDGTIASVQFFVNGSSIVTDVTSPYYTTYSLTTFGSAVVTALVADNDGNKIYTAPLFINSRASLAAAGAVVNLVSPANGATYAAGQQIVFQATHNFGSDNPPKIDFYLNGVQATTVSSEPYQFLRFLTRAGTYDVQAVVRSGTATTYSSVATITVTSNTAPTVTVASSAANATIGTPVTLSATATPGSAPISSVQFFANGVSLGTDNTFPYNQTFSPASAGTYSIRALATDTNGDQTMSAATTVTYTSGGTPTVAVSVPTNLAIGTSATVTATATAAAGSGTIASVEFYANGILFATDNTAPYSVSFTPSAIATYAITAVATDTLGNRGTSGASSIVVAANTAPVGVAVTAPAAGIVGVGTGVTFSASASDTDGSIASVQFFANGVSLGTDTTAPYSVTWTPAIAGSYDLTVVATDNLGATTSTVGTPVTMTVNAGSAPSISISSPATASTVAIGSTVAINATATPFAGTTIANVQFLANGVSLGTDSAFPYTVNFAPTATGGYTITAIATDTAGNQATTSISLTVTANAAPVVTIGSPSNGFTLTNAVGIPTTITASATDADGNIAGVQFFANGVSLGTDITFPYSILWTPLIPGSYTLSAVATDNLGAVTTATVTGTVGSAASPSATITSPSAGSLAIGTTYTVNAAASPAVGTNVTVASVEFFVNGTSLGTDSTFPYSVNWTPSATGNYNLTARVTDTAGNQATSAAVAVTITGNPPPTVNITAPLNNDIVTVGAVTNITATATDDGSVAQVQFFVNGIAIGTDATSPYSIAWTPGTGGTYVITAVSTDNLGATTTSATVTVTASGGPSPTVTVSAPANLAVNTTGTITASATANTGTISSVQFFVNGVSAGTDNSFPYSVSFTPSAVGNYIVTAVATNTAGNQTTSAAATIAVAANIVPTVSIAVTPNAATSVAGTTNTITATVGDTDGSVVSVEFFANGVSLGTDTTAPFTSSWTPTTAGSYNLTAVATDNSGGTTTSAVVAYTVTGTLTTVAVTAPASLAVNSTATITATTTVPTGITITGVQFFANGVSLGTDSAFPYAVNFTPVAVGSYSITAIATDSAGNQATSASATITVAANQFPAVAVTAPANASSVAVASVNTVTATATDADGNVVSVQFFANGVSLGTDTVFPYTATWSPTVAGTYAIVAVATDNVGAVTTSSTNTVTVTNAGAPTATITAPTNGSAITVNSNNTVTATATAVGTLTIARVEFFANGVSLGVDTTFPYSAPWTPVANGTYSITAVATDTAGNQATSAASSVTVSAAGAGPAPTVSLTSPNSGAAYVVGQQVTLGATVGLGNSFVTSVQFFVNGILIGGGSTPPNGQGAVPFWTTSWTPAAPGSYAFTAVVTDAAGVQVTSAPISITVNGAGTPTISIASPASGPSLPVNISQTLVASVTVPSASVLSVQFFANNVSLGTVTSFPYSVTWTPTTTGAYSVIAVVTNSVGTTVTSPVVSYSVSAGTVPAVSVSSPANVNVGFPQTVVATASATQAGAVIQSVQFFVNGVSIGTDTAFPFNAVWTPIVPGSYSLTAVATDTLGNRNTSVPVAVTGNAFSPNAPTVSISTPAGGSTINIGTAPAPVVTITATASDPDGTIASVQFFANGVSLGTISAFPYTMSWTPVAEGDYALTAIAIDNGGNQTTSAPVTVTATAAGAPTVTITAPTNGTSVPVSIGQTVSATATAAFGRTIAQVEFFDNGVSIGIDNTFPYSVSWTPVATGVHNLTAVATDDLAVAGSSSAISITVTAGTPPTVSVTNPINNASVAVATPITLSATASATAPATIASVQFFVNGVSVGTDNTFPYTTPYTPASLGAYTLTAVATDSLGNTTTSAVVNFTVVAAVGPTVVITAPAPASSGPVGTAQTVTATATPIAPATIASVQFFANGSPIGTVTTAPYSVSWTPFAGGPFTLTAVAIDSNGTQGSSGPVTFTATATPPTLTITGPAPGSILNVNTPQTISAVASSSIGTVVSVQFFVNGAALVTDTVFPFSATWTPTTTGTFALTATATDNIGTTTNAVPVVVAVTGGSAPTVVLANPAPGATVVVGTPQTLIANAVAANGTIARVQFFANNVPLGTDDVFPYNFTWTPGGTGAVNLTALATDTVGNQTLSAPIAVTVVGLSTGAPTVAINSPTDGAALPVGVTQLITATATDADGTITSVEFFANGLSLGVDTVFPYNMTFAPGATGTYVLTARAIDNGGNIATSTPVTVTVSGGTAPSIAITNPIANTTLGVNLPQRITANATSASGFITSVQFFLNGAPLSTDNSFPYAADWTPTAVGAYSLRARATDNLGNITDSAPIAVNVGASSAPTVSLTSPINGSSYTVSTGINLVASATDSDGTIAQVEFFVNGASVNVDTAAPYSTLFTPGGTGVYTITARATDNNGNVTTSSPVAVTIGANAAPTVSLTSPNAGSSQSLGSLVLISAAANDPDGTVTSVQFLVNGVGIGTSTSAPFNISWRPTQSGTYALTAVATDNVGNVTTSAATSVTVTSTAAPAVTITNPVPGAPYGVGSTVPINAVASGGNGPIAQVQFFVNGAPIGTDTTSPYSAQWLPGAPGTYSLLAIATDSAGLSSSSAAALSVTIIGNNPPAVTLTSPPTGTSVNGGSVVNLTAIATDVDGTVSSVRFLANGNLVGTSSSVPYSAAWIPSAAGSYSITAQAIDDSGNVTNSSPIVVGVVSNQRPVVSVTSPGNGSSVRVGSGTSLAATASDPDGTISSVQFFANGLAIGAADTIAPYTAQWTPNAEGLYRITAQAIDNSGAATTSTVVTVLAVTPGVGGADAVYSGSYVGAGELGRFTVINVRGKSATFIGFSTNGANKIYYFPSMTVDVAGGFAASSVVGQPLISGAATDTGVSGTLDGNRVTFIGPAVFPGAGAVAAGLYSGNFTGKPDSTFVAIVGADGSITVYGADGTFNDAGAGTVAASGNFTVTTLTGNRFTGKADPATGFLTGTLTGGPGGTFFAAVSSGVSFSDGFLRNLSSRGQVGTGANILIAGFTISGNTPKQVMVRAIGPTLGSFGVAGALANPQLQVFSGNVLVAANDNWGGAGSIINAANLTGAFPLSNSSLDAVVVVTLPPGGYNAQVSGVGGTTGIGLIEIYDVDTLSPFSSQKVTNLSTRAMVGPDQAQLAAGFVVSGNTPKKVLIRAAGPTMGMAPPVGLGLSGVLADPMLRLVRIVGSTAIPVRENDNWEMGNDVTLVRDAAASVGAFPFAPGSKDSVILINLPPGTYSAQVSGPGTATGIALVEVYEVP